jgi:hypothetical protein
MSTAFTDRELPEYLMTALMRFEAEAYRAGEHRCCEGYPSPADMPNPSAFGGCKTHGPRTRASLTLLLHAMGRYVEDVVDECAYVAATTDVLKQEGAALPEWTKAPPEIGRAVLALAPECKTCRGSGFKGGDFAIDTEPCPDCSRGKAWAHWRNLVKSETPA